MSGKNTAVSLIVASVILGGSIFGAAMVSQGLLLAKEPVQPRENIITTTVGHVNLGRVYRESRGMDISLTSSKDNTVAVNLIGLDPNNFNDKLKEALDKTADDVSKAQNLTGDKAIKAENLIGIYPFTLHIRTYLTYASEYVPNYELTIQDQTITIPAQARFLDVIRADADEIAKSSAKPFAANMFISDPAAASK